MTPDGILVIAVIVYSIVCGIYAATLGKVKGWDGAAWFFAGFLFGVLGLIAAAGMPLKKDTIKSQPGAA